MKEQRPRKVLPAGVAKASAHCSKMGGGGGMPRGGVPGMGGMCERVRDVRHDWPRTSLSLKSRLYAEPGSGGTWMARGVEAPLCAAAAPSRARMARVLETRCC
jgi:hypothetical protein